ncbi:hypothetical protein HDU96_010094 [Phlyctochytrium bullatum]|nr:hypothetical protein HDU96_010094 [Phlyctochytrium bullatum]
MWSPLNLVWITAFIILLPRNSLTVRPSPPCGNSFTIAMILALVAHGIYLVPTIHGWLELLAARRSPAEGEEKGHGSGSEERPAWTRLGKKGEERWAKWTKNIAGVGIVVEGISIVLGFVEVAKSSSCRAADETFWNIFLVHQFLLTCLYVLYWPAHFFLGICLPSVPSPSAISLNSLFAKAQSTAASPTSPTPTNLTAGSMTPTASQTMTQLGKGKQPAMVDNYVSRHLRSADSASSSAARPANRVRVSASFPTSVPPVPSLPRSVHQPSHKRQSSTASHKGFNQSASYSGFNQSQSYSGYNRSASVQGFNQSASYSGGTTTAHYPPATFNQTASNTSVPTLRPGSRASRASSIFDPGFVAQPPPTRKRNSSVPRSPALHTPPPTPYNIQPMPLPAIDPMALPFSDTVSSSSSVSARDSVREKNTAMLLSRFSRVFTLDERSLGSATTGERIDAVLDEYDAPAGGLLPPPPAAAAGVPASPSLRPVASGSLPRSVHRQHQAARRASEAASRLGSVDLQSEDDGRSWRGLTEEASQARHAAGLDRDVGAVGASATSELLGSVGGPMPASPADETPPEAFSLYGQTTCVICLNEMEVGDRVRELVCRHVFHAECVDGYIIGERVAGRGGKCPICVRNPFGRA